MIENPQIIGNNHTNQVIDEKYQDNVEQPIEQPVEQQVPQESNEVKLRRSTRVKRSTIPNDLLPKGSLKENELITQRLFLLYLRKIPSE